MTPNPCFHDPSAKSKSLATENAAEDSHDLLPLLKGDVESVRASHIHNTYAGSWAFREGDWVLVEGKSGYRSRVDKKWEEKHGYPKVESKKPKLFNLKKDVGQRNDLAAKHPEKVKAMQALMKKIRQQGFSAPRLAK